MNRNNYITGYKVIINDENRPISDNKAVFDQNLKMYIVKNSYIKTITGKEIYEGANQTLVDAEIRELTARFYYHILRYYSFDRDAHKLRLAFDPSKREVLLQALTWYITTNVRTNIAYAGDEVRDRSNHEAYMPKFVEDMLISENIIIGGQTRIYIQGQVPEGDW